MPRESGKKRTVYLLMSAINSQHRITISKFVMEQGHLPLYPSMIADFYPGSKNTSTEQEQEKGDELIRKADEVWVFGEINTRLVDQITIAKHLRKPVRYFDIDDPGSITEIPEDEVEFEQPSGRKK